jgi:hypothetical protein
VHPNILGGCMIFFGKPGSIPDRAGDRLFPDHAFCGA